MKPTIYILGSGGLGRELYCMLCRIAQYDIGGFVEVNQTIKSISANGVEVRVISEDDFLKICINNPMTCAVIALGNPSARRKIAEKFASTCHFPNIVDPSAIQTGVVVMGRGNIITPQCILTDNIEIGDFNFINTMTTVGHDVKIGSYNVMMPMCNISGEVTIGHQNMFGANSFILQGLTVGSACTIGVGSVVLRRVTDGSTWYCMPAKKIDL